MSVARIRELLSYNPQTGRIFWTEAAKSSRARPGHEAGFIAISGYRKIGIDGKKYYAHRIAWLLMTGAWPSVETDHRNGNKSDNRWENLREATKAQNQHNIVGYRTNTSGYTGVHFNRAAGRWCAQIKNEGVRYYLGVFATAEAARDAYLTAKARLHSFQPQPRRT